MICELLGPAGAGKTTLLRAAVSADTRLAHFSLRRCGDVPRALLGAGGALPTLAAFYSSGAAPPLVEAKRVVSLAATTAVLEDGRTTATKGVLLDEGPIFLLTRLRVFSGALAATPSFTLFQERLLDSWAELMDLVVWVDAPDEELIRRIKTRPKAHRAKALPADQLSQFLARYRRELNTTLDALRQRNRTQVIVLDTHASSVESGVRTLVQEVGDRCRR